MPNYCNYDLKVSGKRKNVEEFIKVIKADYDYEKMEFSFDRHIGGRVFAATVDKIETFDDDIIEAYIQGYCAWSVSSCMLDQSMSYYNDLQKRYGDQCRSTTLEIESKKLNLAIEVYSTEIGCCFAEHYLIENGEFLIDDCEDYYEYCIDDYEDREDFEENTEIKLTDKEWEEACNEGWYIDGGFGDWEWSI